jgi:hypothetical protein
MTAPLPELSDGVAMRRQLQRIRHAHEVMRDAVAHHPIESGQDTRVGKMIATAKRDAIEARINPW